MNELSIEECVEIGYRYLTERGIKIINFERVDRKSLAQFADHPHFVQDRDRLLMEKDYYRITFKCEPPQLDADMIRAMQDRFGKESLNEAIVCVELDGSIRVR